MSNLPLGWRLGLPLALLPAAVTVPSPLGARAAEPEVRVLLQEAPVVEVSAGGAAPLQVEDNQGRTLLRLPPGQRLRLRRSGDGLRAELLGGGPAAARSTVVPLAVPEAWIDPPPGSNALLAVRNHLFRGRLRVLPAGERLQLINHVGLESYLPSVVGSEMPASWPQAALRAQAVAARTYALRMRRPAAPFDVKATVASQVYRGVEAETPATRKAVASTRAKVLMHGDELINAVFHSSSGGSTENSGDLWRRQLPYLVSVPDFDDRSPVRSWEKSFDGAALERAFPESGGATRIDVLESSTTGRVRRVRVIGPRGSLTLSGARLRERLGLRSTLVTFAFENRTPTAPGGLLTAAVAAETSGRDLPVHLPPGAPLAPPPPLPAGLAPAPTLRVVGRGYGHGVGMSQWGAYGMALRGQNYEQILRHFYRGTQLRTYVPR